MPVRKDNLPQFILKTCQLMQHGIALNFNSSPNRMNCIFFDLVLSPISFCVIAGPCLTLQLIAVVMTELHYTENSEKQQ